jgi:hypothetical protein
MFLPAVGNRSSHFINPSTLFSCGIVYFLFLSNSTVLSQTLLLGELCDSLILIDGSSINCKIREITDKVIFYKNCNDSLGKNVCILKSSINRIKHPDGTWVELNKRMSNKEIEFSYKDSNKPWLTGSISLYDTSNYTSFRSWSAKSIYYRWRLYFKIQYP